MRVSGERGVRKQLFEAQEQEILGGGEIRGLEHIGQAKALALGNDQMEAAVGP